MPSVSGAGLPTTARYSGHASAVTMDNAEFTTALLANLEHVRTERGWSTLDLAVYCGVAHRTAQQWREGSQPKISALWRLTKNTDVGWGELLP